MVERFRPTPIVANSDKTVALWWFDNAILLEKEDQKRFKGDISHLPWTGYLVLNSTIEEGDRAASLGSTESSWFLCKDPAAINNSLFKKLGFSISKQNLVKLSKQYPSIRASLCGHSTYRANLNISSPFLAEDSSFEQSHDKKRRGPHMKKAVLSRVRLVSRKNWLDYINHWA